MYLAFPWQQQGEVYEAANTAEGPVKPLTQHISLTSGECLQMSESADAAIRLRATSGSCRHRTSRGTAPASTTAWESSGRGRGRGRGGGGAGEGEEMTHN